MTKKELLRFFTGGRVDIIALLLELLRRSASGYCVIGGLGVNAYVSPLISLDLDIVVVANNIEQFLALAREAGFTVETFPHSTNLAYSGSDLRIQIQTDPRYQAFPMRAVDKEVLSYDMKVAALPDILEGKVWAYLDQTRRKSKRQKDLADIIRILEAYPELKSTLPDSVAKEVE